MEHRLPETPPPDSPRQADGNYRDRSPLRDEGRALGSAEDEDPDAGTGPATETRDETPEVVPGTDMDAVSRELRRYQDLREWERLLQQRTNRHEGRRLVLADMWTALQGDMEALERRGTEACWRHTRQLAFLQKEILQSHWVTSQIGVCRRDTGTAELEFEPARDSKRAPAPTSKVAKVKAENLWPKQRDELGK